MKISRLAPLLLLACVVVSNAQDSPGGLGKAGSSEITSPTKQNITQPLRDPDYASYPKNPTFKRLEIRSKPDAGYTEEARRNDVRGQVVLRVLFAATGQVTRIRVVKGLPHGLTERAIAAARLIEFEPAELDGRKVDYPLTVVYNFKPH